MTFGQTGQEVIVPKLSEWKRMFVKNLAGSKQQSAGDGGSVVSVKHRVVPFLWLELFLQSPSIISAVEVVIIPGKTENTHSCA